METQSTRAYTRFKFLEGINRMVKSNHVTRMKNSVRELGCLRAIVVAEITFITGNPQLYILDGQHLFMALRALRLPIPYVQVNVGENIETLIKYISKLNSTAVKWALKDYVYAWKSLKQEYIDLERYHLLYSMSYTAIGMLGLNRDKRSTVASIIKKGEFSIVNDNFTFLAEEAYNLLQVESLGEISRVPDRFVAQLLTYYNNTDNYDNVRIKQNIIDNIDLIRATARDTVDEVLQEKIFV